MKRILLPAAGLLGLALTQAPRQDPTPGSPRTGTVRFTTSCRPTVRQRFNQAVALLHSFAFGPAEDEFRAVLAADSSCTMAWWGLALGAWGNPFAAGVKSPAQIARGLEAVGRARTTGRPTPRESGYVEAVARLYEQADSLDQRTRLLAYRDAMASLLARAPHDTEAIIFHALALAVSADPVDKSYASQLEAGATLEELFRRLPDHPGLAHYIIHTYDVPPLASRAAIAAGRYSRIAPTISHALHMPSHTWTRVGEWRRSISANTAAGAAARREGSGAEELHSADYLVYADLQLGRDSAARAILLGLPELAGRFDPTSVRAAAPAAAGWFALAAIPARYALERGAWAEAARLEVRASPVPFADAMTWFARGLGAARMGDTLQAAAAVAELARLRDRLIQAHEDYWSQQVEIQRLGVAAWRSFAAGSRDEALAVMGLTADREDATEKNAITPGPLAPARELLGEMLLEARRPAEALAAFDTVLRHEPNRRRALAGAKRAAAGRP